jgi:ATP/maltotriose-dependent transcriptional regulator MalT
MARKEKNIHYIYKTTCNVTGRYYIGMHSTYNLDDGYMGSGLSLRRSIRKYGNENHTKEILEFLSTREELVLREIEIVTKELIDEDLCMNLKCGGEGGFSNEEHRHKFTEASKKTRIHLLLESNDELKQKCSKLSSDRLKKTHSLGKINYNTFEGKTHSEQTKQLISEIKKGTGVGESNSQYGTCWITKDGSNKKIKKEDIETYLNEGWLKGRK